MSSWSYSDVAQSSHGRMICVTCGKEITSGQYRYRQKSKRGDWHYQVQHEKCCLEDSAWAKMDKERKARQANAVELSNACIAFKNKWGVSDLDDYILEADFAQLAKEPT